MDFHAKIHPSLEGMAYRCLPDHCWTMLFVIGKVLCRLAWSHSLCDQGDGLG